MALLAFLQLACEGGACLDTDWELNVSAGSMDASWYGDVW